MLLNPDMVAGDLTAGELFLEELYTTVTHRPGWPTNWPFSLPPFEPLIKLLGVLKTYLTRHHRLPFLPRPIPFLPVQPVSFVLVNTSSSTTISILILLFSLNDPE